MAEKRTVHKARAWVTDSDGTVYMITADAPHVQQLPGGTIKAGEDPAAAILREVAEETGFRKARIVARTGPIRTPRGGVVEESICFRVEVSGKRRAPKLTRREARRGLTVTAYRNRKQALKALRARLAAHGRTAVRRDLALARAILAA